MFAVGRQLLPLDGVQRIFDAVLAHMVAQKLPLFHSSSELRRTVIKELALRMLFRTNGDGDAHTHLNAEHVVRGARQFGVLPHVTVQIEVIHPTKVLQQVLAKAVERQLIDEAVIGDKHEHAVLAVEPVNRPPKKAHVHVVELHFVSSLAIFGVRLADAAIDLRVFAVLVVVVFVDLAHVVGRIADDDRHRALELALHALAVLLAEHGQLLADIEVERIHKAQPLKGCPLAATLVVGGLDIERGDVVRHQHHFVGKQLLAVELVDVLGADPPQQVDHKVARARTRVEQGHAGGPQLEVELVFEHLLHTSAHKIDNRLRCIDNPVCIGRFDAIPLKEALVDGVDEPLPFAEVGQRLRCLFNHRIKAIKRAKELAPVEAGAGQRRDDALDLARNHVVLHKILVEQLAHQALGQHVLDEHLVDGGLADVGVERLPTNLHEPGMRPLERRVVDVGVGDARGQPIGQGGDLLTEVGNRLLEACKRRHLVVNKRLEQAHGGAGILEFGAADLEAILEQD